MEQPSSTVPVPRAALLVLVVLSVFALVALGFILGRRQGPQPGTVAPSPQRVQEAAAAATPPGPDGSTHPGGATDSGDAMPSPAPAPSVAATGPAPSGATPATSPSAAALDPDLRRRVADYMAALDADLAVAAHWDDPDALAQALVTQASQGDPRGMEQVLAANRRALEAARALVPPAPCREYHEDALEVLTAGNRLVAELGAATLTGDTFELGRDLAPAASELKEEVLELRARRREILARFQLDLPDRPGGSR